MIQFADGLLRNGKGLLLVGLLVTFLTACGGSDDNDTGGNPGGPNPGAPSGDDGDDPDGGNDNGDDDDNTPPAFKTFQAASLVIGQPDFSSGEPHQGGMTPDANSLYMPLGAVGYSAAEDILFIADSENARVLGFNGIPDVNNTNADFVLGQADFTSSNRELTPGGMYSPEAVTTTNGQLIVTDTDRNRVAVYDGIPTAGGAEPALVIGQPATDVYTGACDQSTLLHPHAHFVTPDGKVLVADAANNRVLVWNEMPAESGAPADFVLGQVDFENCSFRETDNFQHPGALWSDGERLIVADSEKHRIFIWNTFPTENFQVPDVILGQADMEHVVPNDDNQDGTTDGVTTENPNGDATARTLNYPRDIAVVDGNLYVADMNNHRVLIWNEIPSASFTPADTVLGQQDFTHNAPNAATSESSAQTDVCTPEANRVDGTNEKGFQCPVGVSLIDDRLFVTEWRNSRVLVFEKQ